MRAEVREATKSGLGPEFLLQREEMSFKACMPLERNTTYHFTAKETLYLYSGADLKNQTNFSGENTSQTVESNQARAEAGAAARTPL